MVNACRDQSVPPHAFHRQCAGPCCFRPHPSCLDYRSHSMNGTSQRESYSSKKVAAASPTRTENPLSSINRHRGFGEPSLPPIRTCTLPSRPTPDVPAQYQIRNKPFLRSRSESCHSTAANDLHASASFSAQKILNVFQRIRLRLFRACGLASTSSSVASSRRMTRTDS